MERSEFFSPEHLRRRECFRQNCRQQIKLCGSDFCAAKALCEYRITYSDKERDALAKAKARAYERLMRRINAVSFGGFFG